MWPVSPAHPDEAETLTAIAFAAKGHWGYPAHWMDWWRPQLTVTAASVAGGETHVVREAERILGFVALRQEEETLRLEDLFVLPAEMRRGVGAALFRHARERARELGFEYFEWDSDPHAAGFYERMGAERIGTYRMTLEGQPRELPLFRCHTSGGVERAEV